jgi:hypothetical protein
MKTVSAASAAALHADLVGTIIHFPPEVPRPSRRRSHRFPRISGTALIPINERSLPSRVPALWKKNGK